ncbi:MAG: RluA family pseudouridine synthase [Rhodothermia bacterium]|nr:MAG: RluA family pseudouridine synthase [Rhodothermia bacterium]
MTELSPKSYSYNRQKLSNWIRCILDNRSVTCCRLPSSSVAELFTMSEPEKQEVTLTITVPRGYREEARLDVYLTEQIQNATRAKVQRGIRDGRVKIDGNVVKKRSYTVQPGDQIECLILKSPRLELLPEDIPLDILYEDDDLLVVNKPAGMVVHPGYGNRTGTLVHALLHHVGAGRIEMEEVGDEEFSDNDVGLSVINIGSETAGTRVVRPGIVHRLDKDTTGAIVVAKNDEVHAHLARQFANRTIRREYHAIVWGSPDPKDGRIESYLGRDPRDRRRVTSTDEDHGRLAVTNYRTLESLGNTTLVEFKLETGRTHQIRAHAKMIGHPVFGDVMYGGNTILKGSQAGPRQAFFRDLFKRLPRQALHAYTLGFVHPVHGTDVLLVAPFPDDMNSVIEELKSRDLY